MAPAVRSSATWSRLARMIAACSAARRPDSRRIRITDGVLAPDREGQAAEIGVSRDQDAFVSPGVL